MEMPRAAGISHWYLDSGASEHFSPHRQLFKTFKELEKPCEITTAEGTTVWGVGIGTIMISAMANNGINTLQLNNVIYAPQMDANLLSAITLYDHDYEISMNPAIGVNILKDGIIICNTVREGSLFRLKTVGGSQARAAITAESIDLWHRRLGHLGEENVRKLERLAEGIKLDQESTIGTCSSCLEGRQTRQPSHDRSELSLKPLDLIHSDTSGQISPTSIGGANYYVTFTDDATRMTYMAPMKSKSAKEMLEKFQEFKAEVKKQLGRKIKRLRTDGGGEYEKWMGKHLKGSGIIHETTAPYSPDQNGVAERANRTIMERVKAIIAEAQLDKRLWMDLADTVVYLKNRSPTSAVATTPYELWHGAKPNLSHLRIIGSTAYVHVPKEKRTKLDTHSHKGIMIGYGGGTNQYKIWDLIKKYIVVSRDVVFIEGKPVDQTPATYVEEPRIIHDSITVLPRPPAEAQQLLPSSPDPQLGLARLYVYGLRDIDRADTALKEAERLGYRLGNREMGQLADGYRDRADRLWNDAKTIRGCVYGATDPKAGACGSRIDVPAEPWLNHHLPTQSGLLAEECGGILTAFFETKRAGAAGKE
jgi:hypothetical protein